MTRSLQRWLWVILALVAIASPPAKAWFDETHIAIAKVAGYPKWFNANGADLAKLKAGSKEAHNHYVNNAPQTVVTPQMVWDQVDRYNKVDPAGHLYGAILGSVRDYLETLNAGRYPEYHMAFCAHYVGDLSQPLHNIEFNQFNRTHHKAIDGIINDDVLDHLDAIRIDAIQIRSEADLVDEIARIANLSKTLAHRLESEDRLLTPAEAYGQLSHSASLFKAILGYVEHIKEEAGQSE